MHRPPMALADEVTPWTPSLVRVLVTPKEAHVDEAFVGSGGRPAHQVTTTGSTGCPTTIWFPDAANYLIDALSTITHAASGSSSRGRRPDLDQDTEQHGPSPSLKVDTEGFVEVYARWPPLYHGW